MRRATAMVLAGILLVVATVAVSAALAPSIGASPGDGARRTLVGVQGGGYGWHEYGSLFLLNGSEEVWREEGADSYFDVTMLPNGSVMVGFMHAGYRDCGPYEPPCSRTGFRIVDPTPRPHVVYEYSFPVRSRKNSEVHDVEALDGGGFLLTDMDRERIFVVEDGEVVWEWTADELYEAPPDPTRRDWLHINDVDVIPCDEVANASDDGECYLVSVRNANQLVVVERGAGVVEVINRDADDGDDASCTRPGQLRDRDGDGDVRCGDPDVLNHQHNPQWLDDGAVLVADSDNDRVVELHRAGNGSWEPAWTLERAGVALNWPRDADRLPNGNTLVTDTLNRRILEVNESGTVVWSTRTERIPYEADRLPHGESVGAPRYGGDGPGTSPRGDVPLLSPALVGLRAVAPWLPYWFTEPQLGLTGLGLVLVAVGGGLRISDGSVEWG